MENPASEQNQNKKINPLYLLIGALAAALLFQFFYFSHQMKKAKQEAKASVTHASVPAGKTPYAQNPFAPNFRYSQRALPSNFMASQDFFEEDPFAALDRIHSRLSNIMNTARTYAPIVMQQMNRDLSSDFIPAVDIEETETSYQVRADIPGLEKDKINITAENNTLVIQGVRETQVQHEDEKSGIYTAERSYGSFARTVALPGPIDESNIKADYKDGVLTIQVPKEKPSAAASKRIPVQ